MDDELRQLLQKYNDDNLSGDERRKLVELLKTPEGRRVALSSDTPEAVFLSRESKSPGWESFWGSLKKRVLLHRQLAPHKIPWFRLAAAVVVLGIAVFIFVSDHLGRQDRAREYPGITSDEPPGAQKPAGLKQQAFKLRYRLAAEVLGSLRPLMSDEAELHLPEGRRELQITDKPENLERIARALEQLDRPPVTLRMRLRLLYALGGAGEPEIEEVGGLDTGAIDESKFRLEDEVLLTPMDGRRYSEIVDERYQVQCFAQLSEDGTAIELREFSIYDLETKRIVRRSGLRIPAGGRLVVKTGERNDRGEPLVFVITLDEES